MADLKDFQFELDGYVFGLGAPVLLEDGGFDPGVAGWDSQDQPVPQGDGQTFGVDYLRPPTWAWQLGTDQVDTSTALKTLATFTRVWRGGDVRRTPNAVMPLRYQIDGRVRRVYGRPRRLQSTPSNRILGGWLPIQVDFVCADALHYDDVEQSTSIGVTPSVAGGLTVPLMEPLSTLGNGAETTSQITVGGDSATWPTIVFEGPVSNPYIRVADWHVGLRGQIEIGEVVTIDTAPWARTVLRQDGASLGGRLDRETYLEQARLEPGSYNIIFGGGSDSDTATATVTWRNASHAL